MSLILSLIFNLAIFGLLIILGVQVFRKKNRSRKLTVVQVMLTLVLPILPFVWIFWAAFGIWFVYMKDQDWYNSTIQKIKDLT